MIPEVILHNAVSVDGRVDWFTADVGKFYELAARWKEDATLAGTDTILKAYPEERITAEDEEAFEHIKPKPDDTRPLLVIPDSRGRLRHLLHLLRHEPYWRDTIILISNSTPESYINYLKKRNINFITEGEDHVNYEKALDRLNTNYGVKVIRIDSGGTLNGILLRAGLVSKVSLLIHPVLVGGNSPASMFRAPDLISANKIIKLKLEQAEETGNGLLWVRYEVVKQDH